MPFGNRVEAADMLGNLVGFKPLLPDSILQFRAKVPTMNHLGIYRIIKIYRIQ
jgi:hypothetical protein